MLSLVFVSYFTLQVLSDLSMASIVPGFVSVAGGIVRLTMSPISGLRDRICSFVSLVVRNGVLVGFGVLGGGLGGDDDDDDDDEKTFFKGKDWKISVGGRVFLDWRWRKSLLLDSLASIIILVQQKGKEKEEMCTIVAFD